MIQARKVSLEHKPITLLTMTRKHKLWKDINFWIAAIKYIIGSIIRLQKTAILCNYPMYTY